MHFSGEIQPFVQEAIDREVKDQKAKLEADKEQKREEVVRTIITELRPTILRVIKATVSQTQTDLSNLDGLLRTIITQLRPVVLGEVQRALATSTYQFDAQVLTETIMSRFLLYNESQMCRLTSSFLLFIDQITPFVQQALRQEVQEQKKKNDQLRKANEDRVVRTIISELRPTFVRIIQATVAQSDLTNYEGLFQTIIVQLRPVVLAEVRTALQTSSYTFDAQVLTNRIMGKWLQTIKVNRFPGTHSDFFCRGNQTFLAPNP